MRVTAAVAVLLISITATVTAKMKLKKNRKSAAYVGNSVRPHEQWDHPESSLHLDKHASHTPGSSSSANHSFATEHGRSGRQKRQSIAIPPGAVIGIIPKFGWLLYEGDNNDELEFDVEVEFLYRFPSDEETSVGTELRRYYENQLDSMPASDDWLVVRRQKRMVRDKTTVYKGLAGIFGRLGLEGKACLLKTICEIADSPLLYDGIVGEILNIALIPSRHTQEGAADGLEEYRDAERLGASGANCAAAFTQCPISLFRQLTS